MDTKNWYKSRKAVSTPIYESELHYLKTKRYVDENLVDTLSRVIQFDRKPRVQKIKDLLGSDFDPAIIKEAVKE